MKSTNLQNPIMPKIFWCINLFFLLVWTSARSFDVYKYALTGALYEFVWLPALLAFLITCLGSLFFWISDAFRLNSVYFRLLGFSAALLVLLFGLS